MIIKCNVHCTSTVLVVCIIYYDAQILVLVQDHSCTIAYIAQQTTPTITPVIQLLYYLYCMSFFAKTGWCMDCCYKLARATYILELQQHKLIFQQLNNLLHVYEDIVLQKLPFLLLHKKDCTVLQLGHCCDFCCHYCLYSTTK